MEDQVCRTVQDVVELSVATILVKESVEVQTVVELFLSVKQLLRPQRRQRTDSSNFHPGCRRPETRQVYTGTAGGLVLVLGPVQSVTESELYIYIYMYVCIYLNQRMVRCTISI